MRGQEVRNLSGTAEKNISQVKWRIHLHNVWAQATAENVTVSGVSQWRGCLLLHLNHSPDGPGIDKEQQITVC